MRQPEDPLNPDTALSAASPVRDSCRDVLQTDGTKAGQGSCHATVTRQEPEAMFPFMQDSQGEDLVNKHVEDNLRRTYTVSTADQSTDDRFASLLRRISERQVRSGQS
ncbi:hypothetical protein ORIO_05945 [Cereibacter azotoformans]|uniref:hypothetical protein n=1 Tax=Cereibacter azotoformans TaxID=43057 RepID=UPI0012665A78|nr:hypothetical protein [Cereibacter azotoformans]ULB09468.1 hypothetical protein ORIO_05945 [Cereibacter azotoformans]